MEIQLVEKIMARNDTTVAINSDRREKLQNAAVNITIATREPCKVSKVVQYLIDNYLDEAVKDLKGKKKIDLG